MVVWKTNCFLVKNVSHKRLECVSEIPRNSHTHYLRLINPYNSYNCKFTHITYKHTPVLAGKENEKRWKRLLKSFGVGAPTKTKRARWNEKKKYRTVVTNKMLPPANPIRRRNAPNSDPENHTNKTHDTSHPLPATTKKEHSVLLLATITTTTTWRNWSHQVVSPVLVETDGHVVVDFPRWRPLPVSFGCDLLIFLRWW